MRCSIDVDFMRNRKILNMMRYLGDDAAPWGVLYLIELWCYCTVNQPDGDLCGLSAAEIEGIVGWKGKRGEFVDVLEFSGLLDVYYDCRCGSEKCYSVHDFGVG